MGFIHNVPQTDVREDSKAYIIVSTMEPEQVEFTVTTYFDGGYTFLLNPLALRETGDYYRVATVHDNTDITITCVDEGGDTIESDSVSLSGVQG